MNQYLLKSLLAVSVLLCLCTFPAFAITSDPSAIAFDDGTGNHRIYVFARGDSGTLLVNFWSNVLESLSETQAMAGTLPYMAPEQLLGGEIDARTDIHAAGVRIPSRTARNLTSVLPLMESERTLEHHEHACSRILRKSPSRLAISLTVRAI